MTEDALLGGRLILNQPKNGSRAAIDALFLAAMIDVSHGQHILEAGAGSGVVSLAVAQRVPGIKVTGLEIQPDLCALARENAARNGFDDVSFLEADITAPLARLEQMGLAHDSFDAVVANPPFFTAGTGRRSKAPARDLAHFAQPGALSSWVRTLHALCRPKGSINLVHQSDALPRILAAFEGRFGGIIVYPLYPRQGRAATRILVRAVKGSRAPLSLQSGMVLHDRNGFTNEADAVLRHGAALVLE